MLNRRIFLISSVATLAGGHAFAATAIPLVDPNDVQAKNLSYAPDSTKVSAKEHPNHTAKQTCANCALYQGNSKDSAGKCPLFPTKNVATKGWCIAWAVKV